MASILGTLSELITPDTIGQISKAIGVDAPAVTKGVGAAGPAVLGSLSQTASTSDGAASLMKMIPQDAGVSSGAMLSSLLGNLSHGGTSADMMNNVMGPGVNAISGTLSQTLGFNVKPILTMAAPLVVGLMSKAAKTDKLDAAGLTKMLTTESQTFMDDPANKETAGLLQSALEAGNQAAALRKTFSDVDWMKVRMAPMAAMYLVGMASPSGAYGETEELKAAVDTVTDAVKNASPTSLVTTAFGNGLTKNELDILKKDAPPNDKILGTIKDAVTVVAAEDPAEAKAYGDLLMAVATNVANADTEGSFLGIGGQKVSKEEQVVLSAIASALGR